jgi:hypothetical protein
MPQHFGGICYLNIDISLVYIEYEMLVPFYRTAPYDIPEENNLHEVEDQVASMLI